MQSVVCQLTKARCTATGLRAAAARSARAQCAVSHFMPVNGSQRSSETIRARLNVFPDADGPQHPRAPGQLGSGGPCHAFAPSSPPSSSLLSEATTVPRHTHQSSHSACNKVTLTLVCRATAQISPASRCKLRSALQFKCSVHDHQASCGADKHERAETYRLYQCGSSRVPVRTCSRSIANVGAALLAAYHAGSPRALAAKLSSKRAHASTAV